MTEQKLTYRANKNRPETKVLDRIRTEISNDNPYCFAANMEDIEEELIKQIQAARKAIKDYERGLCIQAELPENAPYDEQTCVGLLTVLESMVEAKNLEIESLNQEIKEVKFYSGLASKKAQKVTKNSTRKTIYQPGQQISRQKQQLLLLQKKHSQTKEKLISMQNKMREKQHQFSQLNQEGSAKLMTYQQFNQIRLQKFRQYSQDRLKTTNRHHLPAREQLSSVQQQKPSQKRIGLNLKDVQARRKIAESALRVLKKRHQAQMSSLKGKLDFLRDENQDYTIKLKQKTQELDAAELRFTLAKGH